MYIEVGPHVCRFKVWIMLTIIGGLYCVGLMNPIGVVAVPGNIASSIYWAPLSTFHLKTDTESSF
jgi:hypothetical protein